MHLDRCGSSPRGIFRPAMALSLTAGVLASTNNALFTLADFDCNKSDHHISATKFLSATCQSCSCRHAVGRQAGVPETAASRPMEGMCPSKAHKSRKPRLLRNTVLVNVWPTQFINKLINQSYYYCDICRPTKPASVNRQ